MAIRRETNGISIVGGNIRKYRKLLKITQTELAVRLGTDLSQITRIETGKINTTVSTIYAIAEILQVEPFKFFVEE